MAEWKRNIARNAEIRELRSLGFSIPQIASKLKCSKSVASWHCKGIPPGKNYVSNLKARRATAHASGSRQNAINWENKRNEVAKQAEKEWAAIKNDPQMMGFLGLYWGEGNKRSGNVGITNNDPGIIMQAMSSFKMLCPLAKVEIIVKIYPEHIEENIRCFWERLFGCSVKIRPKTWLGKKRKCYSQYGLCVIRFNDWPTRIRILTWLSLWREEIIGTLALVVEAPG